MSTEATPSTARALPVERVNGRDYYRDDRLGEYRATDNPHDRFAIDNVVRATFTTHDDDPEMRTTFYAAGSSPLQLLAEVDRQFQSHFDCPLTADDAFDATEAIKAIEFGTAYERCCFSTPEGNWTLTPTDVAPPTCAKCGAVGGPDGGGISVGNPGTARDLGVEIGDYVCPDCAAK
jgi:hypothetical protein